MERYQCHVVYSERPASLVRMHPWFGDHFNWDTIRSDPIPPPRTIECLTPRGGGAPWDNDNTTLSPRSPKRRGSSGSVGGEKEDEIIRPVCKALAYIEEHGVPKKGSKILLKLLKVLTEDQDSATVLLHHGISSSTDNPQLSADMACQSTDSMQSTDSLF